MHISYHTPKYLTISSTYHTTTVFTPLKQVRTVTYNIETIILSSLLIRVNILACSQLDLGIAALFGPSNSYLASHLQSMCDTLDLPHIEARLDLEMDPKRLSINLYPKQSLLNQAYSDVISFLNWTKMAIIYEHDYGKIIFYDIFNF